MAFHMGKLIWFCLLSSSITLPKYQGPEIEFFKANVFVMLVYSTTTFGLTSSKTKWFVILWCSHLPIFKIGLFRNILVYCVLVELFLRKYFRGRKELFHLLCIAKDAFMSKRRRPTSRVVEGLEKYSFFLLALRTCLVVKSSPQEFWVESIKKRGKTRLVTSSVRLFVLLGGKC